MFNFYLKGGSKMDKKVFDKILETIKNDDIKEYAKKCIDTIPDYFYDVPASSSGKYHPAYTVTKHGLVKHTLAACAIFNHIMSLDCFNFDFTKREQELMLVAIIMHDSRKCGSQIDYELENGTTFVHPLLAATVVRRVEGLCEDEREIVAKAIETHMGQWTTSKYSDVVLPEIDVNNKFQKIVYLADYLASRKDIEVDVKI